jgi:hypothetical protein
MTTTQKIIFTPAAQHDTTASASQNRELKLNSDIIMENIAAWDETPEGKAFREAHDIRKAPAKPAGAHAAGAHTPKETHAQFCEREMLRLNNLQIETAAERDRLKEQVRQQQTELGLLLHSRDKLLRLREQDAIRESKIATDRDQAREQVKTLLAIVSEVYMRLPIGSRDNEDLYGRCRAAIDNVESEEAK